MAVIRSDFSMWIPLIFFVIYISSGDAQTNGIDLEFFDFEQFKHEIFLTNRSTEFADQNLPPNDQACLDELKEVGNGLMETKLWALKLLDAWGKIPSGFFEGNMFELGAFSECFHIEREKDLYPTKYCMANLDLSGLMGMSPPKSYRTVMNDIFFPSELESDDDSIIIPRMMPTQKKTGPSLTVGICIPAICSLDFLQTFVKLPPQVDGKISLVLNEATCQRDEYVSGLRTIDWVLIGLLAAISFFIVISTSYDIICTLYNQEKSQALLAFSFYTNGTKLLSYKRNRSADTMDCLNGIRAISTQWVVMGHSFIMFMMLPITNTLAIPEFFRHYHNMFIVSALVSVDSFFVLSGLLVSYNMLKHLEKTKGRINVPMLYIHRYLRLTPFLAISILFSMSLLRYFGNGPLWPNTIDNLSKQCERNWWSTLLYIQNYYNPKDICFGHSWYLSVDMQLFVFAPLIVYLIHRFESKAALGMILLVLGCIGCTLAVHVEKDLKGLFTKFDRAYVPTHLRYSPWLIGILIGYILFKCRNKQIRIPRLFNLFAWGISLATMAAVIFVNYPLAQLDSKNTSLEYGLYDALSRVGWALGLCYIIFACVHKSGGPINSFLGHPLWQPVSRICYSIYLLHFPIILIVMASLKTSMYFSELTAFHAFLGNYVITFLVSIVATLAFESPLVVIEKLIFGTNKKPDINNNSNGVAKNDS